MALICPKCKTRNRTVAKFCIECIASLPTGCSDSDFAPSTLAAQKASYLNLFRALDALGRGSQPTPRATREAAAKRVAPASKGLWISVASLITLLAIGSAGWLAAGASGWYPFTAGSAQVDPPRPDGFANEVAPTKSAPEIQEAPALTAVQRQIAPVLEPLPPAHASQPAVNEAPRPKAVAPADPMPACLGMNFIAKAQCMASQCLKPAFKAHAQCEAVRRRQQLEEEKRNPVAP